MKFVEAPKGISWKVSFTRFYQGGDRPVQVVFHLSIYLDTLSFDVRQLVMHALAK